MVVVLIIY